MKASPRTLLLAGFVLLIVSPAEAQHGGHMGFSGRGHAARSSRGPSARRGSPRGFSRPGTSLRGVSLPPPSTQFRHFPASGSLAAGTSSASVVIARRNFQPTLFNHVMLRGPIGRMHVVPVVRRPFFVDRRFGFFRFHRFPRAFGFPFCSPVFGFGFASPQFGFFARDLGCFPRPFFSPFFFPVAPIIGTSFLVLPPAFVDEEGLVAGQQMEEAPAVESYQPSPEPQPGTQPAGAAQQRAPSLTLLQLKDGSMYGLTDYWLEDGRLHYITSYGGQNSVPLEQIDFDKTVQLNAERGVEFVLRPKPSTR